MALTLNQVPGFSDLPDAAIAAEKIAIGLHMARISNNAAFGMVRLETFVGVYQHADTVPAPVSDIDGYQYQRSELNYYWVPANTGNPKTGFATYAPPWTMWYVDVKVDQATGVVFSEVGYRGNSDHPDRQAKTNDGLILVVTIAQRQKV